MRISIVSSLLSMSLKTKLCLQVVLRDMDKGDEMLESLQTSGQEVISYVDEFAGASLRLEVGRLQQRFGNVRASLSTWHDFLSRVWLLWDSCERSVTDIQNQLKSMRKILTDPIPEKLDDVHVAAEMCQVRDSEMLIGSV